LLSSAQQWIAADSKPQAIALLSANISRFYTSKRVPKLLGLLQLQIQDTTSALPHLQAALGESPPDTLVLTNLAHIYFKQGQYDQAMALLQQAATLVSDASPIYLLQAQIARKQSQNPQALTYLDKIAKQPPEAILLRAQILYDLQKYNESAQTYEEAEDNVSLSQSDQAAFVSALALADKNDAAIQRLLRHKPAPQLIHTKAAQQLAPVLLSRNQSSVALDLVERGGGLQAYTSASQGSELAQSLKKANHPEKAITVYRSMQAKQMATAPDKQHLAELLVELDSLTAAAVVYDELGTTKKEFYITAASLWDRADKPQNSITSLKQYVASGGTENKQLLRLMKHYYQNKEFDNVVSTYRLISPSSAASGEQMRLFALSSQHVRGVDASREFKSIVAQYPKDPEVLLAAARTYQKKGDLKDASITYANYLKLPDTPEHPDVSHTLASLYQMRDMSSYAIKQYRQGIKDYPRDHRNYRDLAEYLLKSNQLGDAIQVLKKYADLADAPDSVQLELARLLEQAKQFSASEQYFERYVENQPQDTTALTELAELYYRQKKYNDAARTLQTASVVAPSSGPILLRAGMAHRRADQFTEAKATLLKAEQYLPRDTMVIHELLQLAEQTQDRKLHATYLQKTLGTPMQTYDRMLQLAEHHWAFGDSTAGAGLYADALKIQPKDIAIYKKLLGFYIPRGSFDQSTPLMQKALSLAPQDPEILYSAVRYHLHKKEMTEVERYLQKTISVAPEFAPARGMYGGILLARKDYEEALKQYAKAVSIEQGNALYEHNLAIAAHQTGNMNTAKKAISTALSLSDNAWDVLETAGIIAAKDGDLKKAAEFFTAGLQKNPECGGCKSNLGKIHLTFHHYDKAIEHLQWSVQNERGAVQNFTLLGMAYEGKGEYQNAEKAYEQALTLEPQNGKFHAFLIDVALEQYQPELARKRLRNARKQSADGWIKYAEGRIKEEEKNYKAAFIAYKTASRLTQGDPRILIALGRVLNATQQYTKAVEAFGNAMAKDPHAPSTYSGMARSYLGMKNRGQVQQFIDELKQTHPNHPEVLLLSAELELLKGKKMAAISLLEKAYDKHQHYRTIDFVYADVLASVSEFNDAIKVLRKAERKYPGDLLTIYSKLGEIYELRGDTKRALKSYNDYLDAGGSDPVIYRKVQKLSSQ